MSQLALRLGFACGYSILRAGLRREGACHDYDEHRDMVSASESRLAIIAYLRTMASSEQVIKDSA